MSVPKMETNRICLECGNNRTYVDKNGYKLWYGNARRRICSKCRNARDNPKRVRFKNRRIQLDHNPRKGRCLECGYEGLTHLHHDQYDESNPLAYTTELCNKCHKQKHWKLRKEKKENV